MTAQILGGDLAGVIEEADADSQVHIGACACAPLHVHDHDVNMQQANADQICSQTVLQFSKGDRVFALSPDWSFRSKWGMLWNMLQSVPVLHI